MEYVCVAWWLFSVFYVLRYGKKCIIEVGLGVCLMFKGIFKVIQELFLVNQELILNK